MQPIIIIPARLQSVRLPNKMLADIHGKPMIQHVFEAAQEAAIGPVYVACAEEELKEVVEKAGGRAILTDPAHPSGSDRIFEALQKADPQGIHDVVINLQGDLPSLNPSIFRCILKPFESPSGYDITTAAFPIINSEEIENPNVVKVVLGQTAQEQVEGISGTGLYFTRGIPYGEGPFYHHVGIYAYKRCALERFVALPASPLEKRERLEQLRALENGMRIGVALVQEGPMGVDTKDDLEKMREQLKTGRDR